MDVEASRERGQDQRTVEVTKGEMVELTSSNALSASSIAPVRR